MSNAFNTIGESMLFTYFILCDESKWKCDRRNRIGKFIGELDHLCQPILGSLQLLRH